MFEDLLQIALMLGRKDRLTESEFKAYEAALSFIEMQARVALVIHREQWLEKGYDADDLTGTPASES